MVRIHVIRAVGLYGATPEGGWNNGLRPEDSVHTLMAVSTDEGLTGLGSVFTDVGLVKAALRVLEPLYLGEYAIGSEWVSEKLHQRLPSGSECTTSTLGGTRGTGTGELALVWITYWGNE